MKPVFLVVCVCFFFFVPEFGLSFYFFCSPEFCSVFGQFLAQPTLMKLNVILVLFLFFPLGVVMHENCEIQNYIFIFLLQEYTELSVSVIHD